MSGKETKRGLTRRLAQNTLWVGVSNVLQYLVSFVFSIYLARVLGDTGYGKYSLVISFNVIAIFFTEFGFRTVLVRDVAKDKSTADSYVYSINLVKLLLSPVVFGLALLVTQVLDHPLEIQYLIVIFFLSSLANSFAGIFLAAFIAFERMALESIFLVAQRTMLALVGLLVLSAGYGLSGFAYGVLAVNLVFLIISVVMYFAFASPVRKMTIRLDWAFYRYLAVENVPLLVAGFCYLVYRRIDVILLSKLTTRTAILGWYGIAFQIFFLLQMISSTYSKVAYPVMSRLEESDRLTLDRVIDKSLKFLLLLEVPIAFGLFSVARPLIITLYTDTFYEAALLLRIMCWAVVINALTTFLVNWLNSMGQQAQNAKSIFVAMIANIVFNLILIPRYQHVGAAVTVLLSECVYFVGVFLAVKDDVSLSLRKHIIKPVVASAVMAIIAYLLSSVNLIVAILAGVVVYLIMLITLRTLDEVDIMLLRQIILRT